MKNGSTIWKRSMGGAMVLLGLCSVSNASVINTLLSGSTGNVTVSIGALVFNPDPAAVPGGTGCTTAFSLTKSPVGNCNSDVAAGTTLAFTGGPLSTGEGIFINNSDLTSAGITPGSADANNFLTFALHPNLVFSVNQIGPGSTNTNCAGLANFQTCSVFAGSPIVLQLDNGLTDVNLTVKGLASDTGVNFTGASSYIGGFGTTITSLPNGMAPTPGNVQLFFCPSGPTSCNPNITLSSSQHGSFTATAATTVPEPSSVFLSSMGILLLAIGTGLRRFYGSRA